MPIAATVRPRVLVPKKVQLHQAQFDFRHSSAMYRGFVGGRGAGKSFSGAYDLIRRAKRGRTYMVGDPTAVMSGDDTFPRFERLARELGVWGKVKLTPYPNVMLTTGATIRFRTAEDPEKFRGPDLSGVWLNEASLMTEDAFSIAIACLREAGEQGWLSSTFTPKGLAHWTYKVFGTAQPNTHIFHARTADNPFTPREFAANLAKVYSGNFAAQELEGKFVAEDDSSQLIPTAWLMAAMEQWTPDGHCGAMLDALGVDVAHGGADKTVLAPRHHYWFGPLLCYAGSQTPSGAAAALKIMDAIAGYPGAMLLIDSIGYGAAAFEACAQKGMRAYGINFGCGTKARDSTGLLTFRNLRAFAYWSFRELLDPANGFNPALPPDDELLAELCAPKWTSPGGVVVIESKDEIKKRLKRSPDKADAIVLASLLPPQE